MIDIKTPQEVQIMRDGGKILGTILQELLKTSTSGVTLLDIEARAQQRIAEFGCKPSFSTVEGYKWATCLCVNDEVVHGIPTDRKLIQGDLLTIDIGLIHDGLHVDTAWSKIIDGETSEFLEVGEKTLWMAIDQARAGNRIGQISRIIQQEIEGHGYAIVKSLVGHGVGRELHEEPQIPGFLKGDVSKTPLLVNGMTIAIEIIYSMGSGSLVYANDDGWTLSTRDSSLSAVFEHTVAVTDSDPLVLTKG